MKHHVNVNNRSLMAFVASITVCASLTLLPTSRVYAETIVISQACYNDVADAVHSDDDADIALGNNDTATAIAKLNAEVSDATNAQADCPGIYAPQLKQVNDNLDRSLSYLQDKVTAVHANDTDEEYDEDAFEAKLMVKEVYMPLKDMYWKQF